jgi:hypothetical protein
MADVFSAGFAKSEKSAASEDRERKADGGCAAWVIGANFGVGEGTWPGNNYQEGYWGKLQYY